MTKLRNRTFKPCPETTPASEILLATRDELEAQALFAHIRHHGSLARAARTFGVGRATAYRIAERAGIDIDEAREAAQKETP
jgi:hypothetical protein